MSTHQAEIERRYGRVREAAGRDGLDAVIVAGNEYTGFEGAVTYLSGFVIVHRYAYVLLPLDEPPAIVFPSEARYVGEHGTTWIEEQEFVPRPGEWLRDRCRDRGWKRVGVFGLDYVMTVRDFTALQEGGVELVSWDVGFDHARAVKSDSRGRVRAGQRPHQHRGLLALPRWLRGRAHRGGDPGRVRAATSSRRDAAA